MTSTTRFLIPVLSTLCFSTVAVASPRADMGRAVPSSSLRLMSASDASASHQLVPALRLAEVEVVNTPQPTPAAPVVQPAPVVAPTVAPVVAPAPAREVIHHHDDNYMSTIAVSALMGALAGGLVGGALYYLNDNQTHASRIGYWAAGGVLVGAGVGVVQIVAESRTESVAMSRLPHDPAPTYRLALLTSHF
ncbi:MAG TPA: hypothetical protein VGP07_00960 [Polyangia bacterium]|jgi:hypothetical protein